MEIEPVTVRNATDNGGTDRTKAMKTNEDLRTSKGVENEAINSYEITLLFT